ncbi:MAG: RNA-binding S4 domain-containing protein [Acetobacteraceae bacterium]|nr:RNA-binding S4 domain-containing protein [Acetobacteraceae bacterium]
MKAPSPPLVVLISRKAGPVDRDAVEPATAFQRLDTWLWCARFMRQRSECARMVTEGAVRINRQPTDKPHARLRVGDVLTVPCRGSVRVIRVLQLAKRRGPASEARRLYDEISET